MTRILLTFLLGLALGLLLNRRAAESAAICQRYAAVKADELDGPTDMGLPAEDVL